MKITLREVQALVHHWVGEREGNITLIAGTQVSWKMLKGVPFDSNALDFTDWLEYNMIEALQGLGIEIGKREGPDVYYRKESE